MLAHAGLASLAAVLLWRALAQVWVGETATDPITSEVLSLAIPAFSAAASALAIAAGIITTRPRRFLALDAISWSLLLVVVFALTLGRLDREFIGVLFVFALALRVGPAVIACMEAERLSPPLVFATAFTVYAALAAWHQAAALPLGDQVHYLLVADRLAHGSIDASIDADLFRRLSTLTAGDFDTATHVFNTPYGPRAIQGYAIPLLLLPGWLAAGRLGAELVVAVFAALASVATMLILRDTIASARLRGYVWAMTTFLAPAVLLAFHIYPNAFGAAAIGFAYRFGITAPVPRPLLAGIAAGLTLFLNPRDGLVLAVLLVAMWFADRREFRRFAIGAAAVGVVAAISNAFLYGNPLPYIGYFLAVIYPQDLTGQTGLTFSFVSFEFWIGLPGMLFDRTFGIAGVAPWLFIAVVGIPAALGASRRVFVPAAATLGLSLIGLSLYHFWEGGYAPSARYFVDVLPLAAPFVAYGLAVTHDWWMRIFTGVLIGVSAVETLVLCAMPSRALNDGFQHQAQDVLDQILGLNPLGWLPSFAATAPDWYVAAYLRLLPAVAILAALAAYGWRRRGAEIGAPARTWTDRRLLIAFLAGNAVALAVSVFALWQPWVVELGDVPASLATRWLPVALGIATVLAVVIGGHLPRSERTGFFARHFLLYLVVPLTLLVLRSLFRLNAEIGAIYLLLAVGLGANCVYALWRAAPRLADVRLAVLIGATMLGVALIMLPYVRTVSPTASDEPVYLVIMQSMTLDRDLDLANDWAGQRYYEFYPEPLPSVHGVDVGDAIYSIRDMGVPVLAAVPFALGGRTGVLVLVCIFGAFLAAQLYFLLRELAFERRVALLAVAATVFVHPFLTYTTQIYPDLIAALIFVTVVRLVRQGTGTPLPSLALASAFVGALPWLTTRAWFVAVGLGLVIVYATLWPRRDLVRRFLAAALPFTALVLVLCYLNWRLFGLFMPGAGYYIIRDQQEILVYAPWNGIPGSFFDRAFGLVPRAPVYLLAFIGVAALWRRRRLYGPPLAALVLGWGLYLIYIADLATWHADGGPPSRYLLAGLPFLVVAVAGGLETVLASAGRLRAVLLAFTWVAVWWSAFIAFVYAVLPELRYEYVPFIREGNPVRLWLEVGRVIRPSVQPFLPSYYAPEAATFLLVLPWVVLAFLLAALGYVMTRRLIPSSL